MAETNADVARRGYEAVARGDIDAIEDFLHPEVKWHAGDPDAIGACRNREQVLGYLRDARIRRRIGELVEVIDAGENVVVIMRSPAGDGRQSRLTANVTTFRDGKAVEMVHYPDPDDARAAAGLGR
jgi:ketosteroid isomerase-like protein